MTNLKMNETLEYIKYIINYTFRILFFIFSITLLLNQIYPDFINSIVNINLFMVIVIILGTFSILFPLQNIYENFLVNDRMDFKDFIIVTFFGIFGGLIIFFKFEEKNFTTFATAILGGIFIIVLSLILLKEIKKNN